MCNFPRKIVPITSRKQHNFTSKYTPISTKKLPTKFAGS